MIYLSENKITDLRYHILRDFKELIPNIEEDYKHTYKFDDECIFYTWIEEGVLLGYMGIIRRDDLIFCSYTKIHNRKIYRKMYKQFKEIYKEAEEKNIPLLTDGTNFMHCKNHVEPYNLNGIDLYRWKL